MIKKFIALAVNSFMKIQYQNLRKKKGFTTIACREPLISLEALRRLAHEDRRKKVGELAAVGAENSCFSLNHRTATARAMKRTTPSVALHRFVVALLVLLEEVENLYYLRFGEIALLEHRRHLRLQFFARGRRRKRVAPVLRELDVRVPHHANEHPTRSFAT